MGRLVSIDFGAYYAGYALWVDNYLVDAGEVCGSTSSDVVSKLLSIPCGAATFVGERMRKRYNKTSLDNNLKKVSATIEAFQKIQRIKLYYPDFWKGSVPKDIHQKRFLEALDASELSVTIGKSHNAVDAVGIGLFYLDRINKKGSKLLTFRHKQL